MKHVMVLLTVVALMLVMLAMSVAPAFAQGEQRYYACYHADAGHIWFC